VWTAVDVLAILGSIGGALAAILNLFSGATYVLFLPLVLPVVSLVAALQREGLIAEVGPEGGLGPFPGSLAPAPPRPLGQPTSVRPP
jgi:hypothetical protein